MNGDNSPSYLPFQIPAHLLDIWRAHLAVLTFRRPPALQLSDNLFLFAIHALGIAALYFYFPIAWLWLIVAAFAIVASRFTSGQQTRYLSVTFLAPFGFVYFLILLRFVYGHVLNRTASGYYDDALPDWRVPLLHIQAAAIAASIYTAICLVMMIIRSRQRAIFFATILPSMVAALWASVLFIGQRTRGATGSDPYAYAQMGVDLATHGTPVHRYIIFPEIANVGIPWYPIVHIGYHLPGNLDGDAVSVWPIGGAFAYALAGRIFGEQAMYWVNPLFSLLCALMAGLLAWELTRHEATLRRALVAALTVTFVASARVQVDWAIVTMADAQAEFFSMLTIYFGLRALRDTNAKERNAKWTLLAGTALAAAYWVRHTQIILFPALAILLCLQNGTRSSRLRALVIAGACALLLALPDLWYHQLYLGGWLHPESAELALFSFGAIADTSQRLYQAAFAGNEFGWLALFVIYGGFQFARRAKVEFTALAVWLVGSLAIHLPYAALRLRDLLPEFPVFAFAAGYGITLIIFQRLRSRSTHAQVIAGIVVFASLELLTLRLWNTVPRVWEPPQPIFGYMNQVERESFSQIAALTPLDAVIGATLDDGAIDLYSQRSTFRPGDWTANDLREFIRVIRIRHSGIYLLEDSAVISSVVTDLSQDFRVVRIATFDVPLFGNAPIANPGALWRIDQ